VRDLLLSAKDLMFEANFRRTPSKPVRATNGLNVLRQAGRRALELHAVVRRTRLHDRADGRVGARRGATATAERVVAGGRKVEVERGANYGAGQRVLAERA
jgi:hypothetical protein